MGTSKRAASSGKPETLAEGIYRRNGTILVAIWDPERRGKVWHPLGPCKPCGKTHEGSTLADARKLKRALEAEKANGRRRRGQKTVAEWAGRYEGKEWIPGDWLRVRPRKAESTNIHNDSRVRPFARAFAGRTLGSITPEEATLFALEFASSFKEVHALFNDACALQFVESNPFAGIKVPRREGRTRIAVLTPDELEQLLGMARAVHGSYGPTFAAMVQAAAWTGLRPGELFLLSTEPGDQVNYIDFKAGLVHVDWQLGSKTGKVSRPKKDSVREVVLLPGAEDAFRSVGQTPGKPLFLTPRGLPFNARTHFYYWDPVRKAFMASLPAGHHLRQRTMVDPDANLDFYELRHFFGSTLAHPPAGVTPASPYEIAAMMGHGDGGQLAMKVYVHVGSEQASSSIRNAWRRAS